MTFDWMVYDPEAMETEFYATEAEALAAAMLSVSEYLDGDGWDEGVESILILRVTHRSVCRPAPFPEDVQEAIDADPNYKPPYDEYVPCTFRLPTDSRPGREDSGERAGISDSSPGRSRSRRRARLGSSVPG